jgi:hypothetical protein
MRKLISFCLLVLAGVGFFLATERRALAYADPGSSLLLLQAAGSILTATALYFRRKIFGLFRRRKHDELVVDSIEATGAESALHDGQ